MSSSGVNQPKLVEMLERVKDQRNLKALAMLVNSPGGVADAELPDGVGAAGGGQEG